MKLEEFDINIVSTEDEADTILIQQGIAKIIPIIKQSRKASLAKVIQNPHQSSRSKITPKEFEKRVYSRFMQYNEKKRTKLDKLKQEIFEKEVPGCPHLYNSRSSFSKENQKPQNSENPNFRSNLKRNEARNRSMGSMVLDSSSYVFQMEEADSSSDLRKSTVNNVLREISEAINEADSALSQKKQKNTFSMSMFDSYKSCFNKKHSKVMENK